MARHFRHCDPRKHRSRRDGYASDRSKDCVCRYSCDAKPTDHSTQKLFGHLERVAPHVGDTHQKPHQHEQRDRRKKVICNPAISSQLQHLKRQIHVVANDPNADKRHRKQSIGDLHTQQDQPHKDGDQNEANGKRGHLASLRKLRISSAMR